MIEVCLRHIRECEELAKTARTSQERALTEELAAGWRALAVERLKRLCRVPNGAPPSETVPRCEPHESDDGR